MHEVQVDNPDIFNVHIILFRVLFLHIYISARKIYSVLLIR